MDRVGVGAGLRGSPACARQIRDGFHHDREVDGAANREPLIGKGRTVVCRSCYLYDNQGLLTRFTICSIKSYHLLDNLEQLLVKAVPDRFEAVCRQGREPQQMDFWSMFFDGQGTGRGACKAWDALLGRSVLRTRTNENAGNLG